MLSYSSPDGRQVETVRVALSGLALRATGYIVSAGEHPYGASYSVAVDSEGRSRRMTVRSVDSDGERSLSLTRSPGGPWVAETATGSVPQPALDEAVDIYLVGSAFAASLPIRRLGLATEQGASVEVTVASISLPGLVVTPVVHRGSNESVDTNGARIAYSGSFGDRSLMVDADGLFVSSEGLMARLG
jgi:hypothetical protein